MTTPVFTKAVKTAAAGGATPASGKRAAAKGKRATRGRAPAPSGGAAPPATARAPRARPATSRKSGKGRPVTAGRLAGDSAKQFASVRLGKTGTHRLIVTEYILALVLIGITPVVMRKPGQDGQLYVPNDFVRLSAVSLLFFILALMASGQRAGKVAAAFGGLVVLGTLYNAAGSLQAIGAIFTTASKTKGAVPSAAPGTTKITTPTFTPVDLSGNPLQQAGGAGAPSGTPTAVQA
jgi:hypothetical protein